MPITEETLSPFTSSSVVLSYCYDHPLKFIATKYTLPLSSSLYLSVPFISCYSEESKNLYQETWLPLIKSLYQLSSRQTDISIESVWTIERPNHSDASILNEKTLKKHYSICFAGCQYAAAIKAFMASDSLTQQECKNLVAICHSGGGGSMIQSLDPVPQELPIKCLILMESPHCGELAEPYFTAVHKMVKVSNQRRKRSWSTIDEAMGWIKTHLLWKDFHPDVIQIISETYFRPDPEDSSRISMKTMPEQEMACFMDDGHDLKSLAHLRSIYHALSTHLIFGSIHDMWPEPLYQQIEGNIEEDQEKLASVTVIEGRGHYLPVQMPEHVAYEIYSILLETSKSQHQHLSLGRAKSGPRRVKL
ncbi:hypothetical protein BDQ17DRAFT_1524128 [Cyathus striatus]|nr:hypothetical protein BDQ17DRAFT_1524128 [Cyathus striatus]